MGKATGIILAAGKGVRMKSDLPKVLHEVVGLPMLFFVIEVMREVGIDDLFVVVGNAKDMVKKRFADAGVTFADQDQQLGTGHAVMTVRAAYKGRQGNVVVINGDNPLLQADTIRRALKLREDSSAACVVVTAEVEEPKGYGRIIRNDAGLVTRIVEERDASDAERKVREINSGNYVFNAPDLATCIDGLTTENDQHEYLLTDVVKLFNQKGRGVQAMPAADPTEVLGINSREQLADAARILRRRINRRWMSEGVTLVSPETAFIDPRAVIGPDTVIEPYVVIRGEVSIGKGCHVGPFTELVGPIEVPDGMVIATRSQATRKERSDV
jgi:bifunctional UDP-N-acetylglucosamine pyrophosphorylase / glucosamine-1-phosphate N-acetyltransferase